MSYKNDHLLTISNKYGKASGDAKAQLFETYDKIRDLTVSGSSVGGTGTGALGGFLMNLTRMFSPGAFMPVLGTDSMNVSGTSYSTPTSGGNSIIQGGTSAFGYGSLGTYPGFPTGGASDIYNAIGGLSSNGTATGFAASMAGSSANFASYAAGAASGAGYGGSWLLPIAGVISGVGGVLQSVSPYLGSGAGLGASVAGNLLQGTTSATLGAYQNVSGRIVNNADIILSNKVKNIETVVKMLNTQSDIIKKMLKESIEGDSKAIQDM